ncbi:MAG TPA: carboxypeptidase regulatory-like domain-containing protein [Acidobacteriota bacterium]|nr:carboxypeptidase regulatory-like domain-containing protein [Acidobacteriota bacterium]
MKMRIVTLGVALALLTSSILAQSQANTANLAGVVRDQSGAIVPGAEVSATNSSTGLVRNTISDSDGSYQFLNLPPGEYTVRASTEGFATAVIQGVELTVGQYGNLDIELRVSATQEEVVVMGNADIVEKQKTAQANTINQKEIHNLPINGRNFLDFALLTPGVSDKSTFVTDAAVQTPTSGLSFGGQDQRSNYVTIDGVDNMDVISNSVRATLSQEAIQEFQIVRNTFSAEFGRARAGVINIVSKSGTNAFHGNAFWFFRNDSLDARNAFARQEDPPFDRDQFGGTFGGPIVQDKTFFFLSYERLDREESLFVTFLDDPSIFQPTASQLELFGFFASTGIPTLAGLAEAFVGQAAGVLRTLPANFPGTLARFQEESGTFPFMADQDTFSAKVDHSFSHNNTLNLRFNWTDSFRDGAEFGALDAVSNGVSFDTEDISFVLSDTHVFSPTKLNDFKFQYSYRDFQVPTNDPIGPQIALSGVAEFGQEFFNPTGYEQDIFQFVDNYTWIAGGHTIKTGVDFNVLDLSGFAEVFLGGEFSFAGNTIPLGGILDALLGPGNAAGLARALATPTAAGGLGRPDLVGHIAGTNAALTAVQSFNFGLPITYFQGFGDPNTNVNYKQLAFFVQDNWQIAPNFTLNLGLRYDVDFKPTTQNVINNAPPWQLDTFSLDDNNNFAPRLGFAWDFRGDGRQVLRGGYGIYQANFFQAVVFVSQVLSGQISQVFTALSDPFGLGVTSADVWEEFLGTGQLNEQTLASVGLDIGTTPPVILPAAGDVRNPYSQQVSFGYEQQLGADTAFSLDYILNRGVGLIRSRDINVNPVGPNQFAGLRDPSFLQVNQIETSGSSIYHGFTGSLTRRFRGQNNLRVSYTLGKAIDDTTDFITQLQGNDQSNLAAERSLSSFDQRHRLVISGLLSSPWRAGGGQGFVKNLFADWLFSGISTWSSGKPFNLLVGFDLNGDGHEETDRPTLQDGSTIVGRNTGMGPNTYTFDMRLSRQFNFSDDVNFEFIFEAFNLFNNVNYSGVNNVVGPVVSNGFVDGSENIPANQPLGFTEAFDPRQIQFGFRFNF